MVLPDVNVLVYAHRQETAGHGACREWLEGVLNGDEAYAISDLVLSGFVRVVTHPKVFKRPSTIGDAFAFAEHVLDRLAPEADAGTRPHPSITSTIPSRRRTSVLGAINMLGLAKRVRAKIFQARATGGKPSRCGTTGKTQEIDQTVDHGQNSGHLLN